MLKKKLISFIEEDRGFGDITTEAVLKGGKEERQAEAAIIFREEGVLAGVEEAEVIFEHYKISFNILKHDGDLVRPGEVVISLRGPAANILLVERTVLNFLSRMSGIATATSRIVKKAQAKSPDIIIAATRKTAPGLACFDKKAVQLGGGDPHRFGLYDAILIKDNHITLAGGVKNALELAREHGSFAKKIEIEVENEEDALAALEHDADIIMLDNMEPTRAKRLYKKLKKRKPSVLVEVSGGIDGRNVLDYVDAADIISMGCLTHSVKEIDISLYVKVKQKNMA